MKRFIKKLVNRLGIDIKRLHPELRNSLSFDDIYNLKIKDNPVIFDVGANQGQSIERFRKIFPKCVIHSFEPIKNEFEMLRNKYSNDEKIKINNHAIGDEVGRKKFYITASTGNSSFNRVNKNTSWIKKRSIQNNTSIEKYIKEIVEVNVNTLDQYCDINKIKKIDILKIDTQGYEDKILAGSKNILKNNIINFIELEIMFDNVYEKYLSFSDIEKYLLPNQFRFSAIRTYNENLFQGLVFFADVMYINTKNIKINSNN